MYNFDVYFYQVGREEEKQDPNLPEEDEGEEGYGGGVVGAGDD